jgi:LAS superfamily LD-carboxypeptidase LdcB
MELQPEVIEAFGKMRRAAAGAGIALTIISGRRNYEQQKVIWVNKWNKLQSRGIHGVDAVEHILRYSSMPGTSRHHWGTDIDINSLEPAYFTTAKGAKELAWLRANAHNYGFAEVYSPRTTGRSTGYQPEPWHWSYMPLASSYLTQYKQKIGYNHFGIPDSLDINTNPVNPEKKSNNNIEIATTLMIFPGSEFAKRFKIIEDYVLGVSTF